MARPPSDWNEPTGWEAVWEDLPDYVKDRVLGNTEEPADTHFQELFEAMFDAQDWNEAHAYHDDLQAWARIEYGIDFDRYFVWEDWRENYDNSVA